MCVVEWLLGVPPFLAFYPSKSPLVFLLQPSPQTKNTPRPSFSSHGLLSVRYQHASLLQLRYRSSYSLLSLVFAFPLQRSRYSVPGIPSLSALFRTWTCCLANPPARLVQRTLPSLIPPPQHTIHHVTAKSCFAGTI